MSRRRRSPVLLAAPAVVLLGVLLGGLPGAAPAAAAVPPARPAAAPGAGPGALSDLPGVPAAALLAHGRVLVLRPNRLEVALDGRIVRTVAVRQPVDLADLPSLVDDPGYAAAVREAPGPGVRLGAVLAQRPGTSLTGTGLRLVLADTAGAGPARLTGTRARLELRRCVVVPAAPAALRTPPARPPAAPGLRYLHTSAVLLEDVTLAGLGSAGRGGRATGSAAALRADGGSSVVLHRVTLAGGGRGVEARDPAVLHVDGLDGDRVGGAVLDVSGGSGARLHALSSIGAAGPALRLRGVRDAALDGLTSTGDAAALVADDVAGLHAAGVRARGNGLVLGGRGLELVAPDVDAPVEALRAVAGAVVTVTGGTLRGGAAAVDAEGRVHLRGVAAHGPVRGPVRRTPAAAVPASAAWWDRPVRGTGAVVLVVLVAAAVLEVLRGRVRPDAGGGGAAAPPPPADADLVLDLGEAWD